MTMAHEKALAWATRLANEAEDEWQLAYGRGSSKKPARVRKLHRDGWYARVFAAEKFREFAQTMWRA